MEDLEIAQQTKLAPLKEIAAKLGLSEEQISYYGKTKAKIEVPYQAVNQPDGKLILVTSINPTPLGEGKTTMSIGIHDALCKLGYQSVVVLREPSLGPVFGIKGGATGGGKSQVVPMEEINLHFTGDIHAITACNNLLCAAIDNHIFQGNDLDLDPDQIFFHRCLDINDRALRTVEVGRDCKNARIDHFAISVASEIMAILCLADSLSDLKRRLSQILIGYNRSGAPVYVADLKVEGALTILLKEAIKPNLVQTLEHNPAIIHGGPFANIAHGCNSLVATKLGLKLADYVVTEAGFGSDLGGEKFMDIKCRIGNLKPDAVVVNATIRSMKYNGDGSFEAGVKNLLVHVTNMQKYSNHVLVCLNHFATDTKEELAFIKTICQQQGVACYISSSHQLGSDGALALAQALVDICQKPSEFNLLYEDDLNIRAKIRTVAQEIYRVKEVIYEEGVCEKITALEQLGYQKLPVCIAKTPYSLADDPKKRGYHPQATVTVRDVKVCSGAGFIVVYMGNVMTMPGLSKDPSMLHMDITKDGVIQGLF